MPVKRKQVKHRGFAAEAEAWSGVFECGDDFFNDLLPLGFQTTGIGGDSGEAARAAAPEAWQRLGGAYYLAHLWPQQQPHSVFKIPWALEQFGDPE